MNKKFIMMCVSFLQATLALNSSAFAAVYDENSLWTSARIPVCFTNGSLRHYGDLKSLMRKIIEREYSETGIQFTGWGDCNTWNLFNRQPRIAIELGRDFGHENRGGHSYIGPNSNEPNMAISRTFIKTDESYIEILADDPADLAQFYSFMNRAYQCSLHNGSKAYSRCTETVRIRDFEISFEDVNNKFIQIVHEFGHAVGLKHEQDRPGIPKKQGGCVDLREGRLEGTNVQHPTTPDCDSAMNYYKRFAGSPYLSPHDIAALKRAYSSRRSLQ